MEGVDLGVVFREITAEIVGIDNDIKQVCSYEGRDRGKSLESTYIRWEEKEDPMRKTKTWLER